MGRYALYLTMHPVRVLCFLGGKYVSFQVDVQNSLSDPLRALQTVRSLSRNDEVQETLSVIRKNQTVASSFGTEIIEKVQEVGGKRFYDEFLPTAFPTLAPTLRAALPNLFPKS